MHQNVTSVISENLIRHRTHSYTWEPLDHANVRVYKDWFSTGDRASETTRKVAELDRDTTVAKEFALVNSVQRGLNSKDYQPGPLVINPEFGMHSEHTVESLKNWVLETMTD